jgi:uncharacterized membrane protein YkoI
MNKFDEILKALQGLIFERYDDITIARAENIIHNIVPFWSINVRRDGWMTEIDVKNLNGDTRTYKLDASDGSLLQWEVTT